MNYLPRDVPTNNPGDCVLIARSTADSVYRMGEEEKNYVTPQAKRNLG